MINSSKVTDLVKRELINDALERLVNSMKTSNCLPPETVEGRDWDNPRRILLSLFETTLTRLYDDAVEFSKVDLSVLDGKV